MKNIQPQYPEIVQITTQERLKTLQNRRRIAQQEKQLARVVPTVIFFVATFTLSLIIFLT